MGLKNTRLLWKFYKSYYANVKYHFWNYLLGRELKPLPMINLTLQLSAFHSWHDQSNVWIPLSYRCQSKEQGFLWSGRGREPKPKKQDCLSGRAGGEPWFHHPIHSIANQEWTTQPPQLDVPMLFSFFKELL